MEVKHTRSTEDGFKFDVVMTSRNHHAHGALTRADKQVVTLILVEAATKLEAYLREVENG